MATVRTDRRRTHENLHGVPSATSSAGPGAPQRGAGTCAQEGQAGGLPFQLSGAREGQGGAEKVSAARRRSARR